LAKIPSIYHLSNVPFYQGHRTIGFGAGLSIFNYATIFKMQNAWLRDSVISLFNRNSLGLQTFGGNLEQLRVNRELDWTGGNQNKITGHAALFLLNWP